MSTNEPTTRWHIGQRVGRLTVESVSSRPNGARLTLRCDCGGIVKQTGGQIATGRIRSCGCIQREINARAEEGRKARREARRAAITQAWSDLPGEEWRKIPGLVDGYEASNLGRIRCWRENGPGQHTRPAPRLATGRINPFGYHDASVRLADGRRVSRRIHDLVLRAFVGPAPAGMHCSHEDNNRLNNTLENLRWRTFSDNQMLKHKHGTMPLGEAIPVSKLTREQVREIRRLHSGGTAIKALARRYGVAPPTIKSIITCETWRWVA